MEITIKIVDKLDGTVSITSTPTFETMAKKIESGEPPTSGEAYALFALRKIRDASKKTGREQHRIPGA